MNSGARRNHVAILGAGITGCCLALFLARQGFRVSLFDSNNAPMQGASRWNEGKIHLGYLYGADSSLATAKHVLPGGLTFKPLMQQLLEQDISQHVTEGDDVFLIHRHSVVDAATAHAYYRTVDDLFAGSANATDYLCDLTGKATRQLSAAELGRITDSPEVEAGFKVPERSVNTHWLADQLCAAVIAQENVSLRTGEHVTGVHKRDGAEQHWQVSTDSTSESFPCVVNALWQGRPTIDAMLGLPQPDEWSARYRLALFVKTRRTLETPSAVVGVGPFGDIKNYNGRDFYLSWYPAGLVYDADNASKAGIEAAPEFNESAVREATIAGLSSVFSGVEELMANAIDVRVGGGWVVAQGRGALSAPDSSLHRRDRFGVSRMGSYYSVDTGKYSTAPWLA
ncbi:MAG: FAD-binding oxidoreductase, partial [Halioglobus sp.]|nr:FAD-binding oxidoreductase [Halioglobus sp.]